MMSYEGLDHEEEFKTFPIVNNNNIVNVVSDSDSDDNIKNENDNFFDEDIDNKDKANPQTTIKAKVVHAMKMLQTLYNDDANKIVKQATTEKSAIKN